MARAISWGFERVVKPAHLRGRRAVSALVDRRLGVRTTDEAVANALGADLAWFRRTQRALPWTGALRIVRRLRLGPGDVLLDVGCGAGRVACIAARRPVARVVGVDLDSSMVRLARANAAALRGRRAPVEIVEADATAWEIPDDVTCVYMYNPFGGELLRRFLGRIAASAARRPRRIRLVYANPKEHGTVVGSGAFRPAGMLRLSWRPGRDWARTQEVRIYEHVGRPDPPDPTSHPSE